MSLDDNKAIIRSYVETVWNQRQLDRAEEFVAPDFVDHARLPGQAPGLDGARGKWAMYLNAAPDLRVTIEDVVAEDDKRHDHRPQHGGQDGLQQHEFLPVVGVPPVRDRTSCNPGAWRPCRHCRPADRMRCGLTASSPGGCSERVRSGRTRRQIRNVVPVRPAAS
jgi:hypothetical protein